MNIAEPKEAFPYESPSDELKLKYANIFKLDEPLPRRLVKIVFDKLVSFTLLLFSLPVLFLLKIAFIIEGLVIKENSGPMFFYYNGISAGRLIKKYKVRLIKEKFIDQEAAKKHDWIAFSAEWNPESRTHVGQFVKNYYLDELPQFWSVLKGDMSIIGPRPLSVLHYERDIAQGNISRMLIPGGLLGLGHVNKGTSEMGKAEHEYKYIDKYMNSSSASLLFTDISIILRGVKLIIKGGGH